MSLPWLNGVDGLAYEWKERRQRFVAQHARAVLVFSSAPVAGLALKLGVDPRAIVNALLILHDPAVASPASVKEIWSNFSLTPRLRLNSPGLIGFAEIGSKSGPA